MVHPIRAYRDEHGLSAHQFLERVGENYASVAGARVTVARYESGDRFPSIPRAQKIAKATGIPLLSLRPDLAEVAREAAE